MYTWIPEPCLSIGLVSKLNLAQQYNYNNQSQTLKVQPGLIKHIQIQGLHDDFLKVHGQNAVMYSRVTPISKTRIDYILSNTSKCSYFQYIDMNLGLDHSAGKI